mmetsp:Transcript_26963/g.45210  ORF Transcript_26963/g.45210 Transcript_26963/m.45210 type:complete len:400 (+) Transcript_26963:313-1512(+)
MGFEHCRGCKLERDRAERMAAQYHEEKARRMAVETSVNVEQNNLLRLRRRVDGTSILRLWCEYTRRMHRVAGMVPITYKKNKERYVRLKYLWKWRACVREKAWLVENAASMQALNHERAEVARLRETVYLIQEDLTSIETTRHRMAWALVLVRKRHLRLRALKAWREAVDKETLKLPTLVAQMAIKWRYIAVKRLRVRSEDAWASRVLRWYDRARLMRHFVNWRRVAGLPVILHSYRTQLEALQASVKLLHVEQTALRLFKASISAVDGKFVRKGSVIQVPMQELVDTVQGKVASAVVTQTLENNDTGAHLDQYGIGGQVAELAQDMEEMNLNYKQVYTPRGSLLVAERDPSGALCVNYTPSLQARRALKAQYNEYNPDDPTQVGLRRTVSKMPPPKWG